MESFILSIDRMPEYDGVYLVAGWLYHECGNVTPFFKVAECRMNKWVKQDVGEHMTYWKELELHPDTDAHDRPSRLMFPFNQQQHEQ